ncbi:transcriptional repressor [Methylobacterium oxalidis]|uniref:transcriptional repressor n=1 Tax=Methylobacterium oxalidis TaxID=944322 RepID=UPI0033146646
MAGWLAVSLMLPCFNLSKRYVVTLSTKKAAARAQLHASPVCIDALNQNAASSADFVALAEKVCAACGLNFTPIRRRVLEVLAADREPLSAYTIIHRLSVSKPIGPPTIYRALEFLIDAGFVRYVALRKAYMCREHPLRAEAVALLSCSQCGCVSEVASEQVQRTFTHLTQVTGFRARTRTVEIEGQCATCQEVESR